MNETHCPRCDAPTLRLSFDGGPNVLIFCSMAQCAFWFRVPVTRVIAAGFSAYLEGQATT